MARNAASSRSSPCLGTASRAFGQQGQPGEVVRARSQAQNEPGARTHQRRRLGHGRRLADVLGPVLGQRRPFHAGGGEEQVIAAARVHRVVDQRGAVGGERDAPDQAVQKRPPRMSRGSPWAGPGTRWCRRAATPFRHRTRRARCGRTRPGGSCPRPVRGPESRPGAPCDPRARPCLRDRPARSSQRGSRGPRPRARRCRADCRASARG